MSLSNELPPRFQKAYQSIDSLAEQERYTGAFIFGSVARGDYTEKSDFDVRVVVDQHNPCKNINHPIINGVKLDLSFQSFDQLKVFTEQEIVRAERIPMIAESIIIFDKTGELEQLKQIALDAKPKKSTPEDYQLIQFMFYHANDKAQRFLEDDPQSALFSMGINVNDLLKYHYLIQGKWW